MTRVLDNMCNLKRKKQTIIMCKMIPPPFEPEFLENLEIGQVQETDTCAPSWTILQEKCSRFQPPVFYNKRAAGTWFYV